MASPVVQSFDRLDEAERARDALIASGFDQTSVHLDAREDEAGPVQGNFTVGDGKPYAGEDGYDRNFRKVESRGAILLRVEVASAEEQATAARLLGQRDR